MLLLMGGIVLLTLVINGSTAESLVVYLGLNRASSASKRFFDYARHEFDAHMQAKLAELRHSPHATRIDWVQVYKHTPAMTTDMETFVESSLHGDSASKLQGSNGESKAKTPSAKVSGRWRLRDAEHYCRLEGGERGNAPFVIESRIRFLHLIKAQYTCQHTEDALAKQSLHAVLNHSVELAIDDAANKGLSDWFHLRKHIESVSRPAKPLKATLSC